MIDKVPEQFLSLNEVFKYTQNQNSKDSQFERILDQFIKISKESQKGKELDLILSAKEIQNLQKEYKEFKKANKDTEQYKQVRKQYRNVLKMLAEYTPKENKEKEAVVTEKTSNQKEEKINKDGQHSILELVAKEKLLQE